MLPFLPFASIFFTSLRKRCMFPSVYLLHFFSISYSSGYFFPTGFFLFTKCWDSRVPKVIRWLGSFLESSTYLPFDAEHEVAMWSGSSTSFLPVYPYPPKKTNGLSSFFSCIGTKFLLEVLFPLDVHRHWPCLVLLQRQPQSSSSAPILLLSVGIPQDGALTLFWMSYDLIHSNNFYHIDIDS